MADILFSHATVVDGTGMKPFVADVLVSDGKIARIGKCDGKGIDATGKILCPGFVDIHAHSELEALRDPAMSAKVAQGITTEVSGNCGVGVYPSGADDSLEKELTRDVLGHWDAPYWKDFSSYENALRRSGSGTTMAFLVSHSALRSAALEGNPNRVATKDEIGRMCGLLDDSLREGCIGFSTGLYYAPCLFADEAELKALLSTVASHGKLFAVHHRCEGDDVIPSLDEVLRLAKETGVRLEVSHLKAIGRNNQKKVPLMLSHIEEARKAGVDVAFDQYPYTYGSTSLYSLLPPSYLRLDKEDLSCALRDPSARKEMRSMMASPDGWDSIVELVGFDAITVLVLESSPECQMRTLSDIAGERDPYDVLFDLLAKEKGLALMADTTETEENLITILRHDLMCFGTDALYAGSLHHPRSYAAAVHLLSRYGRELKVLPWEDLVRKMTGEGAKRIGLNDAGFVREGMRADLVLFDPLTIRDNATMREPKLFSTGIEYVLVGGKIAARDGKATGIVNGRVYPS